MPEEHNPERVHQCLPNSCLNSALRMMGLSKISGQNKTWGSPRHTPPFLIAGPGFLLFVPHAHGSEVRSLPLIITVLLRSRFAHALRSLVSERKRRVAAHNRVVLGSENPPSRSTVNQALGGRLQQGFWASQPLPFVPCLC